jgi:hypothetical protein
MNYIQIVRTAQHQTQEYIPENSFGLSSSLAVLFRAEFEKRRLKFVFENRSPDHASDSGS